MKITINIKNCENMDPERQHLYEEIFEALVTSGGLDGVKSGQTVIHFDQDANFMGIQLNYWPWRRRKVNIPK